MGTALDLHPLFLLYFRYDLLMLVRQLSHLFGMLSLQSLELPTLVQLEFPPQLLQSSRCRLVRTTSFSLHLAKKKRSIKCFSPQR